jgi:CRP/FNR family transcriptional regulator, anaerobic regulatory protein
MGKWGKKDMSSIDTRSPIDRFLEPFGSLFPSAEWPQAKRQRVLESLHFREMEEGATILREGQVCSSVPFVIEGAIRVFKTADSGREITLYRIEKGESCILSTGCGKGLAAFPATVMTDKPTFAAFMPSDMVRRLFAEGPSFRDFVLEQYSSRMAEVMELVQEIAFRHVDERLHQWLADSASRSSDRRVLVTHQELADHVGTSREVVSRILKDWEQRGALEISRGAIILSPGFEGIVQS